MGVVVASVLDRLVERSKRFRDAGLDGFGGNMRSLSAGVGDGCIPSLAIAD